MFRGILIDFGICDRRKNQLILIIITVPPVPTFMNLEGTPEAPRDPLLCRGVKHDFVEAYPAPLNEFIEGEEQSPSGRQRRRTGTRTCSGSFLEM